VTALGETPLRALGARSGPRGRAFRAAPVPEARQRPAESFPRGGEEREGAGGAGRRRSCGGALRAVSAAAGAVLAAVR